MLLLLLLVHNIKYFTPAVSDVAARRFHMFSLFVFFDFISHQDANKLCYHNYLTAVGICLTSYCYQRKKKHVKVRRRKTSVYVYVCHVSYIFGSVIYVLFCVFDYKFQLLTTTCESSILWNVFETYL